ncbi:peptidoglycan-binding domain-containing protein [Trichothermofontia sp.]
MQSLVNLGVSGLRTSTRRRDLTPTAPPPTGSRWAYLPPWLRSPRLLLQLLSLAIGALLLSVGPAVPPVQAASSTVLQRGSTCNSVRQLQTNLTRVGVYNGPISGYFGSQTEAAVRRYQSTRGLRVDGVAGPATLSLLQREVNGLVAVTPVVPVPPQVVTTQAIVTTQPVMTPTPIVTMQPVVATTPITAPTPIINATLRRGDRGSGVTQLQRSLQAVGAYGGPITGYFGNLTEDGVRRYQRRRGLPVNGVAGPATLTTLASDLNVVAISYPGTGAPTLVPVVNPGTQVVTTTQVATTHYVAVPGVVPPPVVATPLPAPIATGWVGTPNTAWSTPTPITYGSAGGEVRAVQLQLRNLGFYQGPITGYFGPETQAAVYQYQQSRNIQPTGTIGPTTLSHLSREI